MIGKFLVLLLMVLVSVALFFTGFFATFRQKKFLDFYNAAHKKGIKISFLDPEKIREQWLSNAEITRFGVIAMLMSLVFFYAAINAFLKIITER
jgi:hypothetical protein